MMTRKNFKAAAENIALIADVESRKQVALQFVKVFSESNPRFNKDKFLAACGVA